MNDWKYTILTGKETREMTHAEYLADPELVRLTDDPAYYDTRLFLGRTLVLYTPEDMRDPSKRERLVTLRRQQEENPLRYYAPNCQEHLDFINDTEHDVCAVRDPHRTGKALPNSTRVLTPNGPVRMDELKTGDMVYSRDGVAYPVTGIFPQGSKSLFRLSFDNGEVEQDATEDHLWMYLPRNRCSGKQGEPNNTVGVWEIRSTAEIMERQKGGRYPWHRGYIPLCLPVQFAPRKHLIPPYTLGVLIGDGGLTDAIRFSSADKPIVSRVVTELWGEAHITKVKGDNCDYSITDLCKRPGGGGTQRNRIKDELLRLGLWGLKSEHKFIPQEYLRDSVANRWDLLRGLMDTDGSTSRSVSEFCSTSDRLCDDLCWLVRSLGGKAKKHGPRRTSFVYRGQRRLGRPSWRVPVVHTASPFWLPRKKEAFRASFHRFARRVTNIVPSGSAECTCISVASPDRTFLTEDFVVTHNTTAAFIKLLVNIPLLECDPKWEIFTKHGVQWKPWTGPKRCGISTYDVRALEQVVWREMFRKWMPNSELGVFARGTGKRFAPSMDHQYGLDLPNGGYLCWFTYQMDPGTYEVSVLHAMLWDEQGRRSMFNGIDRGMRTTRGRHFFSLTPYHLKGRADTGRGSWIHDLLSGRTTMGHKCKEYYSGNIRKTPHWIYPEEEKDKEFVKWETEPNKCVPPNKKMLKEGRARLYGEWHEHSDIVLDQWDPDIHFIDPLWVYPPHEYTLYRGIDHGGPNPTVILWAAVGPEGIAYIYRCQYTMGKTIEENVLLSIHASGNEREAIGVRTIGRTASTIPAFNEVYRREVIFKEVMDSRSFSYDSGATGLSLGETYRTAGFRRLDKASGKIKAKWVPIVQEMLCPNPNQNHPITHQPGGSRLYIFNTCHPLRREIENWVYRPVRDEDKQNESEVPQDKDDHGPTALGYMVQIPLRYVQGSQGIFQNVSQKLPEDSLVMIRRRQIERRQQLTAGGYRPL